MIKIPYLREINGLEWVREVISEKFQNATELMTRNSVIYGGAIRDAIAGLELVGDIDIAVPKEELKTLSGRFLDDPRWRAKNQASSPFSRLRNAGYPQEEVEKIPMQDIIEFVTFKDAIAQIMVSNLPGNDPFDRALGMARQVDFRCCSMILTADGRVFETIEGALNDCRDRVLRINEESTTIHLKTVPTRIEKLTGRGWTNTVDIEQVQKDVEARRRKEEIELARKHAALTKKHKKMFSRPSSVMTVSTGRVDPEKRARFVNALDSMKIKNSPVEYIVGSERLRACLIIPEDQARHLPPGKIERIIDQSKRRRDKVFIEYKPNEPLVIAMASMTALVPIKNKVASFLAGLETKEGAAYYV